MTPTRREELKALAEAFVGECDHAAATGTPKQRAALLALYKRDRPLIFARGVLALLGEVEELRAKAGAFAAAVDFYLGHTMAHHHCPGRKEPERCLAHSRMSAAKVALLAADSRESAEGGLE